MLQAIERVVIDLFITECDEDLTHLYMDSTHVSMVITLSLLYSNYIKIFTAINNQRLYMFGYVTMATEFWRYWSAVRCCDRITMECI